MQSVLASQPRLRRPQPLHIAPMGDLPPDFAILRGEAEREGFRFLGRLESDWRAGENRFDEPGEVLLGAFVDNVLIGVGGLNRDPYAKVASRGRLRRLYVHPGWRGIGVGQALVGALVDLAALAFVEVSLHTDTAVASSFYRRCGFTVVNERTASHVRVLRRTPA